MLLQPLSQGNFSLLVPHPLLLPFIIFLLPFLQALFLSFPYHHPSNIEVCKTCPYIFKPPVHSPSLPPSFFHSLSSLLCFVFLFFSSSHHLNSFSSSSSSSSSLSLLHVTIHHHAHSPSRPHTSTYFAHIHRHSCLYLFISGNDWDCLFTFHKQTNNLKIETNPLTLSSSPLPLPPHPLSIPVRSLSFSLLVPKVPPLSPSPHTINLPPLPIHTPPSLPPSLPSHINHLPANGSKFLLKAHTKNMTNPADSAPLMYSSPSSLDNKKL